MLLAMEVSQRGVALGILERGIDDDTKLRGLGLPDSENFKKASRMVIEATKGSRAVPSKHLRRQTTN